MKYESQQRKISNLKLTEKYRFQYLGHWVLICLTFLALLDVAVFLLYQQMWQGAIPQGAAIADEQTWRYVKVWSTISVMSLLFAAAIILLAIYTAHRIGGPLIALRGAMADVRDGDLSRRLKFRKYDKMNDVESGFNEMVDALQSRHRENPPRNHESQADAVPAALA